MTALLILKPGLGETRARGLHRLGGTLAGCLLGPALALGLHDIRPLMLVAIGVTSGLAYALQKASYAAFTVAVTATMVLLLSLVGGAAVPTAEHRTDRHRAWRRRGLFAGQAGGDAPSMATD